MRLQVLGSSSKGNCYILHVGEVAIVLECGIRFYEVKKALDFNISKVKCCLLTHSHGDHAKYAKSFMDAGITVYGSRQTMVEAKADHYNYRPIPPLSNIDIPGIGIVQAFDVKHDVRCFGYLIQLTGGNTFCFITDTHYIGYSFKGLTNIILECNFSDDIIEESDAPAMVKKRVLQSHLSFDLAKDFLLNTDLTKVNNIVLVHLSDKNSNAERFRTEIQLLTGKTIHIAEPGMTIDFDQKPF